MGLLPRQMVPVKNESERGEVRFINGYAVFMGYQLMGVRGLGLLVLTWSTVVLLGGFVDELEKDFWSLTFITLVQAARVSDFIVTERLSGAVHSWWGLLAAVGSMITVKGENSSVARLAVAYGLFAVQLLVFAFVLCPLAVLYFLGLCISTGISAWRLIDHDYGTKGGPNLNPAMKVLYSLAVAQGILFGYKTIYAYGAKRRVANEEALWYEQDPNIMLEYLKTTVTGCEKDPKFAKGKNLVTYAMDLLLEPKSQETYISGVRILGTFIRSKRTPRRTLMLIKPLLIGSASFVHTIQRLLETLGPRSPYSGEIREHAARIVAHVAGSIHLEQFPRGVQCISSLLQTLEEYRWRPEGYERDRRLPKEYERDWLLEEDESSYLYEPGTPELLDASPDSYDTVLFNGYKDLVVQGLHILEKLAADEENCRVISNTEDLLSKTMSPLMSDQLHRDHHDEWCSIAKGSMKFMDRLLAAPGETGTKLQSEISGNKSRAILAALECIVECSKCEVLLKRQATKIILELFVDTSSMLANPRTCKIFTWMLLHIFLLADNCFGKMCGSTHWMKKSSHIRKLAGEKLQTMKRSVGDVVGCLSRTVVGAENNTYKLYATHILRDLCHHYTKDDKFLEELKEAITRIMPEVLKEIIYCGLASEEIHEEVVANNDQVSAPGADIEQCGVSDSNVQENASSYQPQNGELLQALRSLCRESYRWIHIHHQLDEIAAKTCSDLGIPVKTFISIASNQQRIFWSSEGLGFNLGECTG